ncbi:transcriptional repressor [Gulosibacter macacae]|uniref:Transcriptional repressor n=1 Tax=Gulosibacter macacae TaxID=2488791 RepID=A0A3P3VV44_9MICO|nr:transcriptional repressor [Gulosibacter macacae]RRJ86560.1 transcriptional repressor [Gulosibacter macacae]
MSETDTAPQRRNTWQREAVREALEAQDGFVTAQELHRILEDAGQRIGLATVYRALAVLVEEDFADTIRAEDGDRYRSCETDQHHHHLMCRRCGRTVEISGDAVERWAAEVGREHGFTEMTHVFDAFGVCSTCASA